MQEEMARISRTIGAVTESKLITRVLQFAISVSKLFLHLSLYLDNFQMFDFWAVGC